jgi:hypothetical protein
MKPKTPFQKMRDNRAKAEYAIRRRGVRADFQWTEDEIEVLMRSRQPLMFNTIPSTQREKVAQKNSTA